MSADYAAVLLTLPIWILIVGLLYVLIWMKIENPLFLQKRIGKMENLLTQLNLEPWFRRRKEAQGVIAGRPSITSRGRNILN